MDLMGDKNGNLVGLNGIHMGSFMMSENGKIIFLNLSQVDHFLTSWKP